MRKFTFSGVYHPSVSAMVNHASKQPVEEALYASGMDFTILQPAMLMQNLAAMERGLARMTAHYDKHGFPGGNGLVLEAILGRRPRSLSHFFAELAAG